MLANPATPDGATVVFDGSRGLLALRIPILFGHADVVIGNDRDGRLWFARFHSTFGQLGTWHQVPADGESHAVVADVALVPAGGALFSASARLLRVDAGELRTIELRPDGESDETWTIAPAAGAGPALTGRVSLAAVHRELTGQVVGAGDREVVLAGDVGTWLGLLGVTGTGLTVTWKRLSQAAARADVRPAACQHPLLGGARASG